MVAHILDGGRPRVVSKGGDVELGAGGVYSGDIGIGRRLRREGGRWMRRHPRAGQSGQGGGRIDKVEGRHRLGRNTMGTSGVSLSHQFPRTAALGGELSAAGPCAVERRRGSFHGPVQPPARRLDSVFFHHTLHSSVLAWLELPSPHIAVRPASALAAASASNCRQFKGEHRAWRVDNHLRFPHRTRWAPDLQTRSSTRRPEP
jgi:hypothetical protein